MKQSNKTSDLLEQRNAELAILYEIHQGMAARLDFQAIVDLVGDRLREVLNTGDIGIFWYDEKANLLHYLYNYEHGKRLTIEPRPPVPSGMFEQIRASRHLMIVDTAEGFDGVTSHIEGTDYAKSGITVPIISGDRVLGIITLQNYEREYAYKESEQRLLTTIAASLGSSLENARLFDETQRLLKETEQRNIELAIINRVQEGLVKHLDFQTIIDLVGDELMRVFPAPKRKAGLYCVMIALYDPQTNLIQFPYCMSGLGERAYPPPNVLGQGLTSKVIQSRQPQLLKTWEEQKSSGGIMFEDGFPNEFSHSWLGVPILSGDRVIGVINLQDPRKDHFTQSDVRLLSTLAASLGVSLENARLFDETQRLLKETEQRAAELAILNSVGEAMSRQLDIKTITRLVGDKVREIFNAECVLIFLYDQATNWLFPPYVYDNGYIDTENSDFFTTNALEDPLFRPIILERKSLNLGLAQEMIDLGAKFFPDAEGGGGITNSFMGVPIIVGEQVKGLVSVQSYREHAYDDSNLRLLSTLASSMGVAIENARLFQETQRLLDETQRLVKAEQERVAELQIINSIQQGLAAELDFQAIVDLVGDKLREVFHTGDIAIRWLDEKNNLVHHLYEYEHGKRLSFVPEPPRQGSMFDRMRANHGPVIWNTAEQGDELTGGVVPGTDRSLAGVMIPIISSDRIVGTVQLENYQREHAFGEAEIRLLTTIAASLGSALENARLFDETQRLFKAEQERVAELQIINSIQQGLAAELDFQAIVDLVGDKLREVLHTGDLGIRWYDVKTNLLHYLYTYEHGKRISIETMPPISGGIFEQVRSSRLPLVLNSITEASKYTEVIPGTDMAKSSITVPIISSDKVLGIVIVEDHTREHAFGESEQRLLTTIAASLGTALENARLFDETQRLLKETEERNAELAILNSVGQALSKQLDVKAIIKIVGDQVRDTFQSEVTTIHFFDPKSNTITAPYGYDRGYVDLRPINFGEGVTSIVIRTRQPLVLANSKDDEKIGALYGPTATGETNITQSYIGVPIIVGENVIGVVSVQSYKENAYQPNHVNLLSTLASSMGVAIENARLFQETQRLLDETQQRNSELAIINSVQAALAAELNIQGIYDAVGDKIREIFRSDNLEIRIFDPRTNMEQFPYLYEKGERITQESLPRVDTGFAAYVARTRETLVINENMLQVVQELGSYIMPGTDAPKAVVLVPLIVGDQVRGLVGLANFEREQAFSDSDVRLLQTLVNSMSVALENARLFNETQRLLEETSQRANELSIINQVSRSMSSQLQVDAIVRTVGDQVRDTFHSEVVNIYLYDPATNMIRLPYSYDRKYVVTEPFHYGSGLTSRVIDTKKPLVLGSFEEIVDAGALLNPNAPEDDLMPQSYLGIPIIVGDKAVGVIDVQSYTRFEYGESHIRLLSTLASSMAVALENARLFEETRRLLAETEQRNRELAIISRIGNALAGQLDPQGIFEMVGNELRQVFDAQSVTIITYDRLENLVHFRYSIEKGERQEIKPHTPSGFSGNILRTRQPLLITHDMEDRAAEYGSRILAGQTSKSYLGVPLIAGGEATGVISLQNIDREDAFDENDLRLLSTLALSMGVALENARLYQETQRHAVEMAALAEIGSDIASTHEMEPVLERLATKTRELMQVRDIALYLTQPDGHTLRAIVSQGKYAAETKAQIISLGEGITGGVVQHGVAEIINDPEHDPRAMHISGTPAEEEEQECLMVSPLISRGHTIGAMSVYRDRDQGLFTQLELDFLVSLARQAAIAIDSARLYAETERRATEMAALAEVSREISATLELQVVLERIVGQARELLAAGNSAVYLLQPDGQMIKAIAAEGDVAKEVLADEDVQLGRGIIGSIIKTGIAEWVNDTLKDPRVEQIPGTGEIEEGEKLMVAPLMIQERAIGVLAVWRNPDDPPFNQAELSFAVGLAQQAVVAIENARLFESAQESQRQMADIIDFLPDATLVIDRQGKVIAWNHAMQEMTGVKSVEIVGKDDYEYALPFYGERRPILIDMVLLPNEELEAKYIHIQRNENILAGEAVSILKGQRRYLNATASALRNSKGEAVGAIESIRDITDQKQAELELQQAKLEAEAANQAKSAFLAMMSHEIRTPMNAIIGMSGLLMDTVLSPDQREFAETIRSSGDTLLTIINDILDFSKIEAGKMTLEEAPFDVRECIETALDLIKVRASEKGIELAYQADPEVPPAVLGDVTRLRQVFINLLGNSVKFTEQGEIVLSVSKGEKKDSLHFTVRDTGIGIPADRVSMLFRPFTQADASTSRRYGGTGLGLALSSRIVEMMGGKMWAESEGIPGKGSTFHFIIDARPAPDWKGRPHQQGEQAQLRNRRLLVVDDNATNLRILELQTRAWGMLPTGCFDPADALAILRKGERFDLAILDMHMPDMTGLELAGQIRKLEEDHPGSARLPLVLSTSLGGREEARESSEFAAILLKPIRQSALFDLLMSLFAGKAGGPAKPSTERTAIDPEMASRYPLHILLAEDNVVNQKLAMRLLSQMGYRADVAANGLEVLQAVKRQPYDVILMDVQMPEMDGLEATRRLCAELSVDKRPRIIAMTANAMQGDREMCLEAGMDDYLSKPIRVDELVNALYLAKPLSPTG